MGFFDDYKEITRMLEEVESALNALGANHDAEPEKKGISWDELSDWVAESEGVQEFEEDSDAEQPVYVTKDTDRYSNCDCELCDGYPEDQGDGDFDHDGYAEDSDCNEQESEPTSERISLLDYRECLFRHVEKKNPESREESHLGLTNVFSDIIWEVLSAPKTATPEEISKAHEIFANSRYLLVSAKSMLNYPGLQIDLKGVEAEIENYLKEKN